MFGEMLITSEAKMKLLRCSVVGSYDPSGCNKALGHQWKGAGIFGAWTSGSNQSESIMCNSFMGQRDLLGCMSRFRLMLASGIIVLLPSTTFSVQEAHVDSFRVSVDVSFKKSWMSFQVTFIWNAGPLGTNLV